MTNNTDTIYKRRTRIMDRLRTILEEEGGQVSERVEEQLDEIVSEMSGEEPETKPTEVHVTPESHNNRVVITGMGVISPVGKDLETFWDSLVSGRSGIDAITLCNTDPYPTKIAGEVKEWNPEKYIEPKLVRRISRAGQFAVGAAMEAVRDAGLKLGDVNPNVGVLLGTGTSSFPDTEQAMRTFLTRGPMRISPFFAPISLANMPTGQVAMHLNVQGYNSTVVTACAAGTQAVGEAYEIVRRGDADVMLAGGTEAPLCELGLASFCVMRVLSNRNDEPTKASRPYDRDRDGFVPAEGAGVMVLESLESALARDATIYAEVIGYGATSDAYHMVMPEPKGIGASKAMEKALHNAGIQPLEVDYINAHGTSTQLNDASETSAIKRALKEYAHRVPVSSTKSMTGHMLGAAGAVEAIAGTLAIKKKAIPPTINYDTPDPECDLDYVPNEARNADVRVVMSNSFGFGGQNAVLILREFQG